MPEEWRAARQEPVPGPCLLYTSVTKRIRLGQAIEGRDEKGIKKTVCAFLKILHPTDAPTDVEFEEYVAYATECRRRVKEQMNKRKPDDEFAKINLSYVLSLIHI